MPLRIPVNPPGNRKREIDEAQIVQVEPQFRANHGKLLAEPHVSFIDDLTTRDGVDAGFRSQPIPHTTDSDSRVVIVSMYILAADVREVFLKPMLFSVEDQKGLVAMRGAE